MNNSEQEINVNIKCDNTHRKKFAIICIITTSLAIISAVLGALSVFGATDSSLHYLKGDAWPYLFYGSVFAGVISSLSALMVFRKQNTENSAASQLAIKLVSLLPFISILVYTGYFFSSKEIEISTALLFVMFIIAAVNQLTEIFKFPASFKLFSSYVQVIFFASIIILEYMDLILEMNSPIKLLVQFSFASLMLSTVANVRETTGYRKAGLLTSFKLLPIAVCLPTATLIICILSINSQALANSYLFYAIMLLAFTATQVCSIINITNSISDKSNNERNSSNEELNE